MGSSHAQLHDLWNHYETLRTRYRRKKRAVTNAEKEQTLTALSEYLQWCEERDLPPRLFMEKRFEAMYRASRKLAIPRITQLKSDRLAEVWGRVESEHYAQKQYDRLKSEMKPEFVQTVRDLRGAPEPHQETVKRKHAAAPDGCLALFRFSGGYHPKSGWCASCTNASICARQLCATYGFDVVALREGRFAQLPNYVLQAALG